MKNNKRAQIYDNVMETLLYMAVFLLFDAKYIYFFALSLSWKHFLFVCLRFCFLFGSLCSFFLQRLLLPLLLPACCRFWCARLIHVDFTLRTLFFPVRRRQHGKVTMNKTDTTNVFMDFFFFRSVSCFYRLIIHYSLLCTYSILFNEPKRQHKNRLWREWEREKARAAIEWESEEHHNIDELRRGGSA